jgi:hypothetical protein
MTDPDWLVSTIPKNTALACVFHDGFGYAG